MPVDVASGSGSAGFSVTFPTTATKRAREHVAETRSALQTLFDALNQDQQKKILRDERVRPILEMYGIDTSSAK